MQFSMIFEVQLDDPSPQSERRVFHDSVEQAVLAGRITLRGVELREAMKVVWVLPGWQYVDPEKEIRAIVLALENNLLSRSQVILQSGNDPLRTDEAIAKDKEREEELGITPLSKMPPEIPGEDDDTGEPKKGAQDAA